jgi:transcriptional regulator with XRE-family HTH domain
MSIDEEVRRATKLLETVMQAAGVTRKQLDQRLGAGPGYVSQVLTGRMELKLRHILAILRALDVEPSVYFQTLYPEGRAPSDAAVMEEFLRRFQRMGFSPRPAAEPEPEPAPGLDRRELERMIVEAVQAAVSERLAAIGGAEAQREKDETAEPVPPRRGRRKAGAG